MHINFLLISSAFIEYQMMDIERTTNGIALDQPCCRRMGDGAVEFLIRRERGGR